MKFEAKRCKINYNIQISKIIAVSGSKVKAQSSKIKE